MHVGMALGNVRLVAAMKELIQAFRKKGKEFSSILKMGRTQLQDAVPMTLGQEFNAFAETLAGEVLALERIQNVLCETNMGATAIGTGLNAPEGYAEKCTKHLAKVTGFPITLAPDLIEATQDTQSYVLYMSCMKSLAIKLSKVCNDLRLLSSGPRCGLREINLPAKQPGSSIMPGKVNPVIPEVVNMVCFRVIGSDLTVSMAAEAGQLQLNVFEPVIAACIFEAQTMFMNAAKTLRVHCVDGITANADVMKHYVEYSIGTVTALNPVIGYDKSTELAAEAMKTGKGILEIIRAKKILERGADQGGAQPGGHDGPEAPRQGMKTLKAALLGGAALAACLLAASARAEEWRPFSARGICRGGGRGCPPRGPHRGHRQRVRVFVVTKGDGLGRGFFGELIGFDDGGALLVGRAVFTDADGQKVFSTLKAQPLGTGRSATGTITGGTGQLGGPRRRLHVLVEVRHRGRRGRVPGDGPERRGPLASRAGKGSGACTSGAAEMSPAAKTWVARGATVALGVAIWLWPVPEGLTPQAWRLFAIFAATIFSVIVGAFPILTASVLAVAVCVLSRILPPAKAYAGFANGTILLIVVAFLVARAIVKCGLGQRLGHLVVALFGNRRSASDTACSSSTPSSRPRSRATRRAPACCTRSSYRSRRAAARSPTRRRARRWAPT